MFLSAVGLFVKRLKAKPLVAKCTIVRYCTEDVVYVKHVLDMWFEMAETGTKLVAFPENYYYVLLKMMSCTAGLIKLVQQVIVVILYVNDHCALRDVM